jgi:prepilin-type N-terminal cleavage/methylation domain-containing protein
MKTRRGFTLLEMLTVVGIILFLMAVLVGVFLRTAQNSKIKAGHALLQKIGIGLARYQADFRFLPPDSGFGLPTTGGVSGSTVLYDAATLFRYLGCEVVADGAAYGPYVKFTEYELQSITDGYGKKSFQIVDPWRHPVGYIGARERVIHNRGGFDVFSCGPDGKTADNDGIDSDGDGAADGKSNQAYDGIAQSGAIADTAPELGEAALNGCMTESRKNKKAGEVLDDINNWDPQY